MLASHIDYSQLIRSPTSTVLVSDIRLYTGFFVFTPNFEIDYDDLRCKTLTYDTARAENEVNSILLENTA